MRLSVCYLYAYILFPYLYILYCTLLRNDYMYLYMLYVLLVYIRSLSFFPFGVFLYVSTCVISSCVGCLYVLCESSYLVYAHNVFCIYVVFVFVVRVRPRLRPLAFRPSSRACAFR